MQVGPDGGMYVTGFASNDIFRYDRDGTGGSPFVTAGAGGLSGPRRMAFGPDGHLYVASAGNDKVLKYDGETGESLGAFIDGGRLKTPNGLLFVL